MLKYYICLLILLILLILLYLVISNRRWMRKQQKSLKPYGLFTEYKGDLLSYKTYGEGKPLIFMSGLGETSPYYAFKNMMDALSANYKVCVIEPCGYGFSSITKRKRTIDEIVHEIHHVLAIQNITRFTFITHSLSGVYALAYLQQYPNEVVSFVGIDSSVSAQRAYKKIWFKNLISIHKKMIFKALGSFKQMHEKENFQTDEAKDKHLMFTIHALNANSLAEMRTMQKNLKEVANLKYTVPSLLFLSTQSEKMIENWLSMHEDVLDNSKKNKIVELHGSHYLQNEFLKEIVETIHKFQEDLDNEI